MNNPFEDRLNDAVEAEQQELTCRNYDDAADREGAAIWEAAKRRDFRSTPSKRRLLRKYTLLQLWDIMLSDYVTHPNWGAAYDVAPGAGRRPRCPQRNAKQRRFVRRQWRDLPF